MSWTLRAAGPEDAEAIAETLQIGFDGYRELAPLGWRPRDARSTAEVARVRARLGEPSTWAMLAEDGGLIAWWGSGIARALPHEAIAAAAGEGYGRMRLFTPRDQARARAFYEREGFEHTGWEAFEEAIGLVLVEYAREPLERR